MPVRSSDSSILRWPDATEVREAARRWADEVSARDDRVRRIGLYGSYARDDWGVGSDADLVVIVTESSEAFVRRGTTPDATTLPVPAQTLIYTESEWEALQSRGGRFAETLARETLWLYEREEQEAD